LLLPLTYLVYRVFEMRLRTASRVVLAIGLLLFAALMSTTSNEVGRLFSGGEGHEIALYYGLYFWAGVVLYVLTAWRVLVERDAQPLPAEYDGATAPAPHFATALATRA
jgi:hypothetical protein